MKRSICFRAACLCAVVALLAACEPDSRSPRNAAPPSPQPARVSAPITPPATLRTRVELDEAASKGLVEVKGSGNGLESINISIQSKSPTPIEVSIPLGSIFDASSGATQSMVTTKTEIVTLDTRGSTRSISIDAACATMHRKTPAESDKFTVAKSTASHDLKKLLELAGFQGEDFRVQQFAIWTITDNPGRDEYVGVGQFEFSNGPDKDELKKIRTLFEKAGISTGKYRALH